MPYTLIISEKPSAAKRIASALAEGKVEEIKKQGVKSFKITRKGKDIVVAPAVGHLFILTEKRSGGKWTYPVFDVEWKPTFETVKQALWSKKYFDNMKALAKGANEFISSCDYDVEGSVIARNILKFICNTEKAKRMKFSTLTTGDLVEAYDKASTKLDFPQIEAGLTRHTLDFFWGINLSRALTLSLESVGGYKTLSTGRVQGPTLEILEKRQREIEAFKPTPFWQIQLICKARKDGLNISDKAVNPAMQDIIAMHKDDKFWEKGKADSVHKKCKGKPAIVEAIERKEHIQNPPFPFDLTTLQRESYRNFGYSPKMTLDVAQSLYEQALISYPRTSSQELPAKIGFKNILKDLGNQLDYGKFCEQLLRKPVLKPTKGNKKDPAHPAIYPTGHRPKKLNSYQKKLYDLIVKRFLAVFGEPAVRESLKVIIDVNKEKFHAEGIRTIDPKWMELYMPYAKYKEVLLPQLNKGQELDVKGLDILDKETQPPRRFTQAGILKEMEAEGLGTKCFTGDCKIMNPEWKETSLEDMWNESKYLCHEDGVEIRKLNTPTAVSLNHNSNIVDFVKPQLVSRRKLEKNEKLYRITVKGGELKVTEDHPIYVYDKDNEKMTFKKAKDVSERDKIMSILSRNRIGDVLVDKDFFLGSKYRIYKNMYLHKFSSKNSLGINKNKLPIRWSSDLAWILGYYYGDGSYSHPKYNGSHQVYFTVADKSVLKIIDTRIKRIFGVAPKTYNVKNESQYKVQCNSAVATLLAKTFPSINGKKRFDIPKEFVGDFLRGFFDADGNVHPRSVGKVTIRGKEVTGHGTPRIKITPAKKEHIEWIKDMLFSIGIDTHVLEGKAKLNEKYFKCYTIQIGGRDKVDRFAYKVGFDVNHKKRTLYNGLLSNSPQYKKMKARYDIAIILKDRALDVIQLKKAANKRSMNEIKEAVKYMVRMGIIKRKRLSPYNNPPNRAVYSLIDKDYLIHSLIASCEHINGELYCSSVIKTETIKPTDPFVYDISVSKESPNFITNNALLVHNSTRAGILETLYDRDYIQDRDITVTKLGQSVITALEKYAPEVISIELTRDFDKDMEVIEDGKKKREDIVNAAKVALEKILVNFKKNEKNIGKHLLKDVIEQHKIETTIGKCKCGHDLIIRRSRKGARFVGCTGYPKCHETFSLPHFGMVKVTKETCKKCGLFVVSCRSKGKRPWKLCVRCGFLNSKDEPVGNDEAKDKVKGKQAEKNAKPAAKTDKTFKTAKKVLKRNRKKARKQAG